MINLLVWLALMILVISSPISAFERLLEFLYTATTVTGVRVVFMFTAVHTMLANFHSFVSSSEESIWLRTNMAVPRIRVFGILLFR